MKPVYVYYGIVCILMTSCHAIDPISGLEAVFDIFTCPFKECCSEKWINLNVTDLSSNLKNQVYGQPLVLKAVVRYLKAHLSDNDPPKALAMSFHGAPGTGKSHVSKIIANYVYKKGMKSQFVHMIASTKEFLHVDKVPMYKDKLQYLIESSVKKCGRSMFVFDEIDKMPPGLIDTLEPYLDNHDDLNGVDYRKAIFIFLSNTAASKITQQTLDVRSNGKDRDSIELKDMERLITTEAVNTITGGFYHSDLLLHHMISAYIPFLPLERKHIKQCIKDYLLFKKYYKTYGDINEEKVREIAEELQYYPMEDPLFSTTGCKRVPEKTAYVMEED